MWKLIAVILFFILSIVLIITAFSIVLMFLPF